MSDEMPDDQPSEGLSKRERQKSRRRDRLREEAVERRRRRRRTWIRNSALVVVAGAAIGILLVNVIRDVLPVDAPEGTLDVAAEERNHVDGEVDYPTTPAAGGPHAPVWQNCGYYEEPIEEENAVHSMEHGAVWLAYDPGVAEAEVSALRDMAGGYVLVSPYEQELDATVVASAWGKQLSVDSVEDPRIEQFIRAFEQGPQTPEPGAVCTRGIGEPV